MRRVCRSLQEQTVEPTLDGHEYEHEHEHEHFKIFFLCLGVAWRLEEHCARKDIKEASFLHTPIAGSGVCVVLLLSRGLVTGMETMIALFSPKSCGLRNMERRVGGHLESLQSATARLVLAQKVESKESSFCMVWR
jgi:hypothetical protein